MTTPEERDPVTGSVHVLLDVDGVINSVRFGKPPRDGWERHKKYKHIFSDAYEGSNLAGQSHGAFTIKYSPDLIDALNALAARANVSFHWLTTWLSEARYGLGPRVGLEGSNRWPVLGVAEQTIWQGRGWWKFKAAQAHAEANPDARIIWIDDDLVHATEAIEWFEAIWPRMLLVMPESEVGLTPEHIAEIEAFIEGREVDE